MRRNPNAWRWSLDPRDPEYDPPPDPAEDMDEPDEPEDDWQDDDPRLDGPRNYIPPYEP